MAGSAVMVLVGSLDNPQRHIPPGHACEGSECCTGLGQVGGRLMREIRDGNAGAGGEEKWKEKFDFHGDARGIVKNASALLAFLTIEVIYEDYEKWYHR